MLTAENYKSASGQLQNSRQLQNNSVNDAMLNEWLIQYTLVKSTHNAAYYNKRLKIFGCF